MIVSCKGIIKANLKITFPIYFLDFPIVDHVICYYEGDSKNNAFFFSTEIITDTGTYIMHQNEVGLQ